MVAALMLSKTAKLILIIIFSKNATHWPSPKNKKVEVEITRWIHTSFFRQSWISFTILSKRFYFLLLDWSAQTIVVFHYSVRLSKKFRIQSIEPLHRFRLSKGELEGNSRFRHSPLCLCCHTLLVCLCLAFQSVRYLEKHQSRLPSLAEFRMPSPEFL